MEQDWFRNINKLVEPKFENVSRVAVSLLLHELYVEERRKLLPEIVTSDIEKPTVTVDFWSGYNAKSFMGSTVHYIQ